MFGRSHLGGDEHAQFLLHTLQPWQCRFAVALKASGLGAGLPHSRTEYLHPLGSQLACRVHHLLFRLGTAGTCNHQRTFLIQAIEAQFLQFKIHIVFLFS